MNTTENRNSTIDIFKYIASIMIVAIHTNIFVGINETVRFVIVDIVCRCAVPFFAVCTGYFLSLHINSYGVENQNAIKSLFKKQLKKLFIIYAICTVLYLLYSIPTWIKTDWFSAWAFVDFAVATVSQGSHYHLWYILSLIYALPLFFLIIRYVKKKYYLLIAIVLYSIMALKYGYINWLPEILKTVFEYMDKISCVTSAIILILPLLLLGAFIQNNKKMPVKKCIPCLVLSVLLLGIEAYTLDSKGISGVSYIFATFPTAAFLFIFLSSLKLKVNVNISRVMASMSLFIYCFHPMIIELLDSYITNSIVLFFVTAIAISILGFTYVYIKRKIKNK